MSDALVVIVTHGSRRGTFVDDMSSLSDYVSERLGIKAVLAHNEFTSPDWRDVLSSSLSSGARRIVFALAFLGRGNHVAKDIMGSLGVEKFESWEDASFEGNWFKAYFTRPLADSNLVKIAMMLRIWRAFDDGHRKYVENPTDIEDNSMDVAKEIVASRVTLDSDGLDLVARLVYASGNPDLVGKIEITNDLWKVARETLPSGIIVLADVGMVAAGLRWRNVELHINDPDVVEKAKATALTRAQLGMRKGLSLGPRVPVVGNAPTALVEVMRAVRRGEEVPFVIASPPGFTNAVEVKEELISSKVPAVVVRGSYGGSNLAVAAFNEIVRKVMG